MLCSFERLIYPQSPQNLGIDSYMVAAYRPCEKIYDIEGKIITSIKAVGYGLPVSGNLKYEIKGHWNRNSKHGVQFEVESYDEIISPTKEGIIAYLASGQINGIGPKIAERIYLEFGNETLDVLDKEPERLLTISGISEKKLQKIIDSYLENRGARDVVTFLAPHGITANRAVKLYQKYKNRTMEVVKEHPYTLCELPGIGFHTADKIALSMGFDKMSIDRVDSGILYTLQNAEGCGHLCLEKHEFVKQCLKLLDTPTLTEDMIACRAMHMIQDKSLVSYKGSVYRYQTEFAERYLAFKIIKQLKNGKSHEYTDLDERLEDLEKRMKITLADEQRNAVKTALSNSVSVITGGPGTGKTMIQKAILDIYRQTHPGKTICCCAPTGRAARRMTQSTGQMASTVHKALNLITLDDGTYSSAEKLEADLVIVDEISMLDIYLAGRLFDALQSSTQIILIGDADQLPSVGPGAVLSEIIASNCIPYVRLDKVFRQSKGSRVAVNAQVIRNGNLNLDYGSDFVFIDSADLSMSAETIIELYKEEIDKYGVDNVALLTPFRQKTETGVNALNERIRDVVNPPEKGKKEIIDGKKTYRVGDKVMQIKNCEDVNNGDIGYVINVIHGETDSMMQIDFGDGRIKEYDVSDFDNLSLGYASTIHKSQGSEYDSVIINLQCAHSIMLNRALIYTAITRSKERVIIVGERRALCISIKKTDTEKRGTHLATRIQENFNKE